MIKYFVEKDKLKALLIPDRFKFSALLKFKIFRSYLRFINDLKDKLALRQEKAP